MSAFEAASKFVAEEIDKRELHHVPSELQAKRLELLSVVEDGIIKVRTWESFEPEVDEGDPHKNALSKRTRDFTKTVNGTLLGELKGVFNFDLHEGSKVTYEADFEKFAWRKLKNVESLITYLESREYSTSIGKKSYHSWGDWIRGIFSYFHSWGNWIRGMPSITHSFKVVTSVVHTTSPTKITLTYEPKSDGSVKVDKTLSPTVTGEAKFDRSKVDTQVVNLMIDTGIAYGCVEVSVDKSGKMRVKAIEVFDGTMTLKQPSSTSAGDASSTEEIKQLQEKVDKLELEKAEAKEEKAEIEEELKREQEDRQKEGTTNREMCDKKDCEIHKLQQELDEKNKWIGKLEAEIEVWAELKDQREKHASYIETMNKANQDRFKLLEDKIDSQAEAVQEVPEPDSGSVEPKLANEDDEVPEIKSEGAAAKVGEADTEDGQARASSQRKGASMLGEHQEASISSGTSHIEGDNSLHGKFVGKGAYGSDLPDLDSQASKMIAVKELLGDKERDIPETGLTELVKGTSFNVSLQHGDGPVQTKFCSLSIRKKVWENNEWKSMEWASCALLVRAQERNTDRPRAEGSAYAIGPAHMVLQDEKARKLFGQPNRVQDARREVESQSTSNRYILQSHDVETDLFDLNHPLLLSYRYWCSTEPQCGSCRKLARATTNVDDIRLCRHMIINDIVFLPLEKPSAEKLQIKLSSEFNIEIGPVVPISTIGELKNLARSKLPIKVRNAEGHLVPCITPARDRFSFIGYHLQFVLTSEDTEGVKHELRGEDCGRIIFCKDGKNRYLPLGMFIGRFKGTTGSLSTPIYQAILLDAAIKDIEHEYQHHVGKVKMYQL